MYRLVSPFWNWQERRVRSGWRLLLQFIVYALGQVAPILVLGNPNLFSASEMVSPALPISKQSLFVALGCLSSFFLTWLVTKFIDRRPFAQIGFAMDKFWWQELLFGALLGVVLMGLIFVVEWSLGWVEVVGLWRKPQSTPAFPVAFLTPLLLFIAVAIQEELLSRGYQIRNLAEGINFGWLGNRGAIILAFVCTSAFFGFLHAANPNATLISTINISLAGLLLGIVYVLTGRLAAPIGLHLTWNLFQGNVFGFPVSGNEFDSVTIIAIQQGGPELWTGGAFGPEAGLIGIVAILIGLLFSWGFIRWRDGHATIYQRLAIYQRATNHSPSEVYREN